MIAWRDAEAMIMSAPGSGSGYLNGNGGDSYNWGQAPTMAQALQSMGNSFDNAGWPVASATMHGLAAGFQLPLWRTVGVQPAMPTPLTRRATLTSPTADRVLPARAARR